MRFRSHSPQLWPSRRHGFTLIELLTVIAVVIVLAAILIPVIGSARASAHNAKCSSNMRQLANSLLLWTNESGGRLPGTSSPKWDEAALEMITGREAENAYSSVLACPADDVLRTAQNSAEVRSYSINPTLINYGGQFSNQQTWGENAPPPNTGMLLNQLTKPSGTALLVERHEPLNTYRSGGWIASGSIFDAHDGSMNIAFCDGHVESVSTEMSNETFRPRFLSRTP